MTEAQRAEPATYRPWFQSRPRLMRGVSLVLFAAVAVLHVALGPDAGTGITALFALPVSLLALAAGRAAGVLAGSTAVVFLVVGAVHGDSRPSTTGWAALTVAFVMVGYLLGDASERLARAEEARSAAESQAWRQREAAEINDHLVQGMAAAKWSLESGDIERSLSVLEGTIHEGQRLVSELIRQGQR